MTEKYERKLARHLSFGLNRHFQAGVLALFFAMLMVPACDRNSSSSGSGTVGLEQPRATDAANTLDRHAHHSADQEIWDVYYMQGSKIGYGHTTVRKVERDRQARVEVEASNHLSITRFGETTEQEVRMATLEKPDGELLEFSTTIALGPAPTVIRGKVLGDELEITTETQGRKATNRIPWTAGTQGFRAIEHSLEQKPLLAGERRALKMLMPIINQVAEVELVASEQEVTKVLGSDVRLLRIESKSRLPGNQAIDSTLWTDERGQVIKTSMAALDQQSFRSTKEIALSPIDTKGGLDLGLDLFVKIDPPLKNVRQLSEITYRVELAEADPQQVFANDSTQSVKSLGPHTAEITVRSLRPTQASVADKVAKSPPPGAEYKMANSILQIDDPAIRKLAVEGRGAAETPVDIAIALERFVHVTVQEKNFSHGFATAAEVAQSRAGDCTEHAVLLAALLRAEGIPSRVAIGLVYVESAASLGYHMWTEAYLDGVWVPLDAIVANGGTHPGYLKLSDASLEGASAYSSFLSVAQVLGQLKVSVVSAQ